MGVPFDGLRICNEKLRLPIGLQDAHSYFASNVAHVQKWTDTLTSSTHFASHVWDTKRARASSVDDVKTHL